MFKHLVQMATIQKLSSHKSIVFFRPEDALRSSQHLLKPSPGNDPHPLPETSSMGKTGSRVSTLDPTIVLMVTLLKPKLEARGRPRRQ
jgi:hypothetical protein